jgi:hypothetical protein
MILGLGWGTPFNHKRLFFSIKAGYEMNYWWNQFHLIQGNGQQAMPGIPSGNVALDGLTLSARFDF